MLILLYLDITTKWFILMVEKNSYVIPLFPLSSQYYIIWSKQYNFYIFDNVCWTPKSREVLCDSISYLVQLFVFFLQINEFLTCIFLKKPIIKILQIYSLQLPYKIFKNVPQIFKPIKYFINFPFLLEIFLLMSLFCSSLNCCSLDPLSPRDLLYWSSSILNVQFS